MKAISLALLLLLYIQSIPAQLPQGFTDELVSSGWTRLIGPVFDETGRGFAWNQSGIVWRLDDNGQPLPSPVLDLTEEVADWLDMGMLGMALDPNFTENGHFYLLYIVDRHHLLYYGTPQYDPSITIKGEATIARIARFTADKTTNFTSTLPSSRKVLLGEAKETGIPILFSTHGVGSLVFGTDGTLLASCGETAIPDWADLGSSGITYYAQALADGILQPKENVGAFRSQLVDCLAGKILRLDPETGDGLPSNPFYDASAPRSPRSRVWALGFRNPFRIAVKPNSGSHFPNDGDPGDLYVGDVGANHWEELSIVTTGGQNCGWPLYEGFEERVDFSLTDVQNLDAANPLAGNGDCNQSHFFFRQLLAPYGPEAGDFFRNPCDTAQSIPASTPTFIHSRPVLSYRNKDDAWGPFTFVNREDGNGFPMAVPIDDPQAAVAGGAHFQGTSSMAGLFLQGENWPDEYRGRYFHIDFNGWIKLMDVDPENQLASMETFHDNVADIVCLVENPKDGCLYYLDIRDQQLRKICYGGSPAPVVSAKADRYFGPSPLEVQFDGSGSFSPSNSPLAYHWDFGDNSFSEEQNPKHTFATLDNRPTPFHIKLTTTDTTGQARSAGLIISLNNTPPKAEITSVRDSSKYAISTTTLVRLEGKASDTESAPGDLVYQWRTYLHHDTHYHGDLVSNDQVAYAYLSPLGCEEEPYWYRIELTVTDEGGLSNTATHQVFPYCGQPFYELVSLSAAAHERTVRLDWATHFEDSLWIYEVEKGNNLFSFEPIGGVLAFNKNSLSKYVFTDYRPLPGFLFYRLKIHRLDGTFDYIMPVMVEFDSPNEGYAVFPNPAKEWLNVSVDVIMGETLKFRLFNSFGALLKKGEWMVDKGQFFFQSINIDGLPSGVYFYEIENGEETERGTIQVVN